VSGWPTRSTGLVSSPPRRDSVIPQASKRLLQKVGPRVRFVPALAAPQKAHVRKVVDHGRVAVAFPSGDLVDAAGADSVRIPVLESVSHRCGHVVPAHAKEPGHLLPGKRLRVRGEGGDQGCRQRALARMSAHLHHRRPAPCALYPAGAVGDDHGNAPQGDVPPSPLGQGVGPRPPLPATGAGRPCVLSRYKSCRDRPARFLHFSGLVALEPERPA